MFTILFTVVFTTGIIFGSAINSSLREENPSTGYIANINSDKVYTVYIDNRIYRSFTATGFAVKAKKNVYLVTAGHVCATNGSSISYAVDSDPRALILVQPENFKIYNAHDLCVIAKLKDDSPSFSVSSGVDNISSYYALGHPNGYPLVATQGNILGVTDIQVPSPHIPIEICNGSRYKVQVMQLKDKTFERVCVFKGPFYKTSIPVIYGSSGSPVINSNSELVGVVSISDLESPGNWAGVVPLEEIKHLVRNIE